MKKLLLGMLLAGMMSLSENVFAKKTLETVEAWCVQYQKNGDKVDCLRALVTTVLQDNVLMGLVEVSESINHILNTFDFQNEPEYVEVEISSLVKELDALITKLRDFDSADDFDRGVANYLLGRLTRWCDSENRLDVRDLKKLLQDINNHQITCKDRGARQALKAFDPDYINQGAVNEIQRALEKCVLDELNMDCGEYWREHRSGHGIGGTNMGRLMRYFLPGLDNVTTAEGPVLRGITRTQHGSLRSHLGTSHAPTLQHSGNYDSDEG